MESTNSLLVPTSIGCHRCDAEAGVRIGREFLCGSCAVEDLRTDAEPPVVLCDVCQCDSTLRLDERFLCGRCALTLMCLDTEPDPDVALGFGSAVSSAIVGQREPVIAWAWEIARRTREGRLAVVDASSAYHRVLVERIAVDDASGRDAEWLRTASAVFGAYAAAVDAHIGALTGESEALRAEAARLRGRVDELGRERDETTGRLRRAERERGALVRHLTNAKEEERSRIAEEIHDDIIQTLVAVHMRLQALARSAGGERADGLAEFARMTAASIGRLRTLIFELRSDVLDRYGLAGTLRELLGRMEEQCGVAFRLDDRLADEPTPEVRANVYRIGQEAITNARKHARAANIHLALEERDGGVLLTLRDDGAGFDVQAVPSIEHAGLRFIRDRAERAGGWISIASEQGVGTEVTSWIPRSIGGDR
jgi:signal transduction histidine kinase